MTNLVLLSQICVCHKHLIIIFLTLVGQLLFLEGLKENGAPSKYLFFNFVILCTLYTRIKIPTCGAFRGISVGTFDKSDIQPVKFVDSNPGER